MSVAEEFKKFTLKGGDHSQDDYDNKVACFMEALCLVLGYNPSEIGNLTPPCVSGTISQVCIAINDHWLVNETNNNHNRDKLYPLADAILRTAPTKKKVYVRWHGKQQVRTEHTVACETPEYATAENQRHDMILGYMRCEFGKNLDCDIAFVKKLAAVAKF